jgi:hypothetical protein
LWNLPETIGHEDRDQRKSGKPEGAEPAIRAGQNERGADELDHDRRAGDGGRKR